MSKKLGFFSNINRSGAAPVTPPVFDVTATLSDTAGFGVDDTITFDIDSTLTPAANTITVYWDTTGVAANTDFVDNELSGNVFLDTNGNATIVRQIVLSETGTTDGNITFTLRTGDPDIGNIIHSQTISLTSSRYADTTIEKGANVDYASPSTFDWHKLYYNQYQSTNDQGELLDNILKVELDTGDRITFANISTPTSNTTLYAEALNVGDGGTSGYLGSSIFANSSVQDGGGGPGGQVAYRSNVAFRANTYVVIDRIPGAPISSLGEDLTFGYQRGKTLVDTGILNVYNKTEFDAIVAANTIVSPSFAIVLDTVNYPYTNDVKRQNANGTWTDVYPFNVFANAFVTPRTFSLDLDSGGSDNMQGSNDGRSGTVAQPAGGGGGSDTYPTVTTKLATIVDGAQTFYDAGNAAVALGGAGGAGAGGDGADPDGVTGGYGGAGFVSDIRGFGNVQYGAGGAGDKGGNTGVTYQATNFRQWNPMTQQYETVTAYPPGTGQAGEGSTITRRDGKVYLSFVNFRRFLSL